jgi:Cu(I)/Ag(I) efflux system membrane fusion protein
MRSYLNICFLLLALALTAGCKDQRSGESAAATEYTCPMHPQIVQQAPGSCPVCHMPLVPRSGHPDHAEGAAIPGDLAFLLQPSNSAVVASVATTRPVQKTIPVAVNMDGIITYDPRQVFTVAARTGGRIERLFVKYNFQPIRKGQKLLEIYSPDLATAQQELLYLVRSAPEDKQLQQAARQKLLYLGATNAQINTLLRTGKESYAFAVYSPYDGYVTGLNTGAPQAPPAPAGGAAPGAGGGMAGMGGGAAAASTTAPAGLPAAGQDIPLREGMYVQAGQPLVRVVNPKKLWADLNVAAGAVHLLQKGMPLQITFPQLPGMALAAKADFLQPYYQEGESYARVRAYLPASHKGVIAGQLVSAQATAPTKPALWVPNEALLDIGTKSVAFKKEGKLFVPVAVSAGLRQGQETQVLGGLQPDTEIAANAQFLVDSESFIQVRK